MERSWNTALWRQFDAAISMLDNALVACPDTLWRQSLWPVRASTGFPPSFAEFWYVAYHALVWLDLYLSGVPEEAFAPPPPFAQGELDSLETLPAQPYAKETLRAYLAATRQRSQTTLVALTDEQARRTVTYLWSPEQPITYLELQLYNLRHVQEHAAQLSLLVGQDADAEGPITWVTRAKGDPGHS